jgi:transcriptional regulator with XRE-family HTH domain
MKVRQDDRWPDAHIGLRRIYEERVPKGMSQAEFGAVFDLGSQGMVWQYLNGYTPLNYDAAAKFARGLRCKIRDFSAEMADELEVGIMPVVGVVARAASVALLCCIMLLQAPPASAGQSSGAAPVYYVQSPAFFILHNVRNTHCMRLILRLLSWLKRVLTPCYQLVFT